MKAFVELQTSDTHWLIRRDVRDLILGSDGLPLASWVGSGQASVVKHGPHRTIYRVHLAAHTVYLKHYRVPDLQAMLSQWVQRSKGRREWELLQWAVAHDVPTVVPLALGEQRHRGMVLDNYLITEAIEGVEPLAAFVRNVLGSLPAARQGQVRQRLTKAVAEMAARMHEAGIQHRDLHAGNVLVRLDSEDRVQLFLIDLHAARTRRRMSWRRSRAEILTLGVNFLGSATATDRLRFLRCYLELRHNLGLDYRLLARDLYNRLWRRARTAWWHRDARCLCNNRRFLYRDIGSAHGLAVAELGESKLLGLLRDPDAPLQGPGEHLLKDAGSSTVAKLMLPIEGVATPVIYKRFHCVKALDPTRALFHRSPALRAWIAGHGLLLRGIATPRPLAVVERTPRVLVRDNYLITEQIEGACSLGHFLRQIVPALPPNVARHRIRRLAAQLGKMVRRLHLMQISHRDMKASNFLVSIARPEAQSPELYLIDLAGVQIWRRLPVIRRTQNLARIHVSLSRFPVIGRTDCLRFLRAYLTGGLRNPTVWKPLWRLIADRAADKMTRNRARGRLID